VPLEKHIEHRTVFVNGASEPMGDLTHDHVHFVEMPPGTPPGFPVTQVLSELFAEVDTPGADGFARHFNLSAPLEQQFLDVSVTQGKAVVEPDRVADDRERESVPWELLVGQYSLTLCLQLARAL